MGTALAQVLNDNGHEVRIWGNIPEQIDEINGNHPIPATSRMWFWMKTLKPTKSYLSPKMVSTLFSLCSQPKVTRSFSC